jgi:SAM-dependent methyltransferase
MSLLNFTRLPLLICCDAHHLPFLPNTFHFVFAYQTLHHFENPIPVVAECYRVLGKGGYLFFNEEPMDSRLRRFLRGNRTLGGSPTRLQRWSYRLHMEKLFWDDGAAERRAGITEARFGIDLWCQTLEPFSEIDVEINSHLRIHNDLKKRGVISWISGIIGGNVKGYALKAGGEPATGDFHQRLMCLDCGTNLPVNLDAQLPCEQCGRVYPFTDGILRMLPAELEVELYPQPSGISPS